MLQPHFLELFTQAPARGHLALQAVEEYLEEECRRRGADPDGPYRGLNPSEHFFAIHETTHLNKSKAPSPLTHQMALFRILNRAGVSRADRREIARGRAAQRAAMLKKGHPCFFPIKRKRRTQN